jgi:hypothetical protein
LVLLVTEKHMPVPRRTTSNLVQRMQEEFEEAPGLVITVERGARFWALDAETCERVPDRTSGGTVPQEH